MKKIKYVILIVLCIAWEISFCQNESKKVTIGVITAASTRIYSKKLLSMCPIQKLEQSNKELAEFLCWPVSEILNKSMGGSVQFVESGSIRLEEGPFDYKKELDVIGGKSGDLCRSFIYGKDTTQPLFSFRGVLAYGKPKLNKEFQIQDNILVTNYDYTLIIWPLEFYFSLQPGNTMWGHQGRGLMVYALYDNKTKKQLFIDYTNFAKVNLPDNPAQVYLPLLGLLVEKMNSELYERFHKMGIIRA